MHLPPIPTDVAFNGETHEYKIVSFYGKAFCRSSQTVPFFDRRTLSKRFDDEFLRVRNTNDHCCRWKKLRRELTHKGRASSCSTTQPEQSRRQVIRFTRKVEGNSAIVPTCKPPLRCWERRSKIDLCELESSPY